jgi:hypothetical protein
VAHELDERCAAVTSHLQIILWRDIFVVVDDGTAGAAEYPRIAQLVAEQSKGHRGGIGGLSVIPPNARPPTAEARRAISDLLVNLGPGLRCVCWLVEGGGFQGAMARAVLTGLRMFGSYPYATHVSTELEDALGWTLAQLREGGTRLQEAFTGTEFIRAERRRPSLQQATR